MTMNRHEPFEELISASLQWRPDGRRAHAASTPTSTAAPSAATRSPRSPTSAGSSPDCGMSRLRATSARGSAPAWSPRAFPGGGSRRRSSPPSEARWPPWPAHSSRSSCSMATLPSQTLARPRQRRVESAPAPSATTAPAATTTPVPTLPPPETPAPGETPAPPPTPDPEATPNPIALSSPEPDLYVAMTGPADNQALTVVEPGVDPSRSCEPADTRSDRRSPPSCRLTVGGWPWSPSVASAG